jgi:Icc-related predicted phosphoesterase
MRILAVSDQIAENLYTPTVAGRLGQVDVILGCGDLPYYYLEFLATALAAPLFYIHGNHDPLEEYCGGVGGDGESHKSGPDGGEDVDGKSTQTGGFLVAGLAGSIRYKPDAPYQFTQPEMALRAAALAAHLFPNRLLKGRWLDVLITHSPPLGIHDGKDAAHVGFRAFLTLMDVFRPRYLLHGHQHRNYGPGPYETMYGRTQVINVHPYRIIEVD